MRAAVLIALVVVAAAAGAAVLSERSAPPENQGGAPAPTGRDRPRADPDHPAAVPSPPSRAPRPRYARPRYPARPSVALGVPSGGRLRRGVQLPASGPDHVTWDPIHKRSPNRGWRRYGTDRLVRLVLRVAREHRRAHPAAPPLLVGDLSRPRGGDFSARVSGGVGHASHQNGLDADVYYPRRDRRPRAPKRVAQVDLRLAQDLVDRFVAAGAERVFTGPSLDLRGPPDVVQPLPLHDNHLHVRIRP